MNVLSCRTPGTQPPNRARTASRTEWSKSRRLTIKEISAGYEERFSCEVRTRLSGLFNSEAHSKRADSFF